MPTRIGGGFAGGDIAILPGGVEALVSSSCLGCNAGYLYRMRLDTGVTTFLKNLDASPMGILLEPGAATALVAVGDRIMRYTLADNTLTTLVSGYGLLGEMSRESTSTIIVGTFGHDVLRINTDTGEVTHLGQFEGSPVFVTVEPNGTDALLSGFGGQIFRINLSTGAVTELTPVSALYSFSRMAVEADGTTALATGNLFSRIRIRTDVPPSITTISPISGPLGTLVTITGANFGNTQGSSIVTFGSTPAAVSSWSDTQIQATVPSLAPASYHITVTTGAGASNTVDFLVTAPPSFSLAGQATWAGSGLGGVTLSLSGTATKNTTTDGNGAYTFASLSNGSYTITPSKTACSFDPASRTVSVSGGNVTGLNFAANCAQAPGLFTLSANAYCNTTAPVAPAVLLMWTSSIGAASYDVYRDTALYQSGVTATQFNNTAKVNAGKTYTYSVLARNSTGTTSSNTVTVAVPSTICQLPPVIQNLSPISGPLGTLVTITGANFGKNKGTVTFGSTIANISSWSDTQIHR